MVAIVWKFMLILQLVYRLKDQICHQSLVVLFCNLDVILCYSCIICLIHNDWGLLIFFFIYFGIYFKQAEINIGEYELRIINQISMKIKFW